MAGERHGRGMASVNQTRPHCVNQMGKTHSKPLVARHGRGTAWARHAMCESALNLGGEGAKIHRNVVKQSPNDAASLLQNTAIRTSTTMKASDLATVLHIVVVRICGNRDSVVSITTGRRDETSGFRIPAGVLGCFPGV
jgi:hypothetical protein